MQLSFKPLVLRRVAQWIFRLVTAAALAIDSFVHADLATRYDPNGGAALSQGDLFRIEAGVSALAALLVLVVATRVVWAIAFLVAASAFGAVMLYANQDIGALGPLPDMYEPIWYSEKSLSAIAEAVAVVTAVAGFLLTPRRAWPPRGPRRGARRREHEGLEQKGREHKGREHKGVEPARLP